LPRRRRRLFRQHLGTREHFITDDVLGAISADGKIVVVEGAAWQDKTERRKTIGRASLSRKMLCRRHNNALSPLDKMAAEFFRYFLEDHLDIFKYLGNDDRRQLPARLHHGQRPLPRAVDAQSHLGRHRSRRDRSRRSNRLPLPTRVASQ
jgi:hypothetical protein